MFHVTDVVGIAPVVGVNVVVVVVVVVVDEVDTVFESRSKSCTSNDVIDWMRQ